MRTMMRALGAVMAAAAAGAAGCAGKAGTPVADADRGGLAGPRVVESGEANQVAVVNSWCPLMLERRASSERRADRALTREWRGQRIAFCCESCPADWDRMSDEARSGSLARAIQREREMGRAME